jgi:MFS family permease
MKNIAICMVCAGFIYSFNLVLPFIIQNDLHYTPFEYGFFSFFITIGYVAGSILSKKFNNKENMQMVNRLLPLVFLLTIVLMLLSATFNEINIFYVMSSISLLSLIIGFNIPRALTAIFSVSKSNFGLVSAVYGFFVFSFGFIINIIVSSFISTNIFRLSILFLLGAIALTVILIPKKYTLLYMSYAKT